MTALAARPRIRLQPAPACDPPFDDEDAPQSWPAAPAQPLLEAPGATTRTTRTARTIRPHPQQPPSAPPHVGTSVQTREAAHRFVRTCLEVLNGYRPVAHLRAVSDPLAAAGIVDAMTRALRRLAPPGTDPPVSLRRVRVCEPRPGVAEISAVLATRPRRSCDRSTGDERCVAAAFRLERAHGRWLCHVGYLV